MKKYLIPLVILLALVPAFVPRGGTAQVSSPYARLLAPSTFANLGTPANGSVRHCSDCSATSPCTGSGTGAMALRVAGAWNCSSGGVAPFSDSTAIAKGSSDATKLLRFEVDGFTTGTTRVATFPNADITVAQLGAQTFTGAQTMPSWSVTSAASLSFHTANMLRMRDIITIAWDSGAITSGLDLGMARSAAGVLEVNNGTVGAYRDVRLRGVQHTTGTRPTCNEANRGYVWYVAGGAGVADTFEVCRKDAADAYAWATLF